MKMYFADALGENGTFYKKKRRSKRRRMSER